MVTYIVHEPPNASADRLEGASQLVFTKDAFTWWAALLPAVWLIWKRMWLELLAFLVLVGLVSWAFSEAGASDLGSAILVAIQIVFGFEAGALYGAALKRRGWHLAGTVSGHNRDECERRFIEAWLAGHAQTPAGEPTSNPPTSPGSWARTALEQARDVITRGRSTLSRA